MLINCLQTSPQEKTSFSLISALFAEVARLEPGPSACRLFLSGNSAALFHLRCMGDENKTQLPAELLPFLENEFARYISFGVKNNDEFIKLKRFFSGKPLLNAQFKVLAVKDVSSKAPLLGLHAETFSVKVLCKRQQKTLNLKFYCNSWFSIPSFDCIHRFSFDNEAFDLAGRAIRIESSGPSPVWILSKTDLMLLKYFSTLAPVTRKVRIHNQLIVDVFQRALLASRDMEALSSFENFKKRIVREEQKNKRSRQLSGLNFSERQLLALRKAYSFVNNLFNEQHSKKNTYHNIWHTDFVLAYSIELISNYFPDFPHKFEITIAAIFHDCNLGLDNNRIALALKKQIPDLSEREIKLWCDKIKGAVSSERTAGLISKMFGERELSMSGHQSDLVLDFIVHTQLGIPLNPRKTFTERNIDLGRAIIQMADLFQVALGDFDLFLKNNFHLMFELNGEPHTWFESTSAMLDQLINCIETDYFQNKLFNLNLFQFDFEGKECLRTKLLKGLKFNRDQWSQLGLENCLSWEKERQEMNLLDYSNAEV